MTSSETTVTTLNRRHLVTWLAFHRPWWWTCWKIRAELLVPGPGHLADFVWIWRIQGVGLAILTQLAWTHPAFNAFQLIAYVKDGQGEEEAPARTSPHPCSPRPPARSSLVSDGCHCSEFFLCNPPCRLSVSSIIQDAHIFLLNKSGSGLLILPARKKKSVLVFSTSSIPPPQFQVDQKREPIAQVSRWLNAILESADTLAMRLSL